MTNLRRTLAGILLGVTLGLSGCSDRVPEPKKEYFREGSVALIDKTYDQTLGRTLYMLDVDNDGEVDIIHFSGYSHWAAPGYENYFTNKDAKIMTPEIREAATQEMHAERKLAELLAREAYRIDQKRINGGEK